VPARAFEISKMDCGLLSKRKSSEQGNEQDPPIKLATTSSCRPSQEPTHTSHLPFSHNSKTNMPVTSKLNPSRPTSPSLFQTFIQLCLCELCEGKNSRQKCQRRSYPRPVPTISQTIEEVIWGMDVALSPRVENVDTQKQEERGDEDDQSPY
jgi:hypothetical protein